MQVFLENEWELGSKWWRRLHKALPCLELMATFIISLDIHPQMCSMGFKSGEHAGWFKRVMLFSLYQASIVLKKQLLSHRRGPESEGNLLQHRHWTIRCLMTLHHLKIQCVVEWENTPDHDGPPSSVPKTSLVDLLVMTVLLEDTWTLKVTYFMIKEKKNLHISVPCIMLVAKSKCFFCHWRWRGLSICFVIALQRHQSGP